MAWEALRASRVLRKGGCVGGRAERGVLSGGYVAGDMRYDFDFDTQTQRASVSRLFMERERNEDICGCFA